jgi:hypothetical protein
VVREEQTQFGCSELKAQMNQMSEMMRVLMEEQERITG